MINDDVKSRKTKIKKCIDWLELGSEKKQQLFGETKKPTVQFKKRMSRDVSRTSNFFIS